MNHPINLCWMHSPQLVAGTLTFDEMLELYPEIAAKCPQIRGVEVFHTDFLTEEGGLDLDRMVRFLQVTEKIGWQVPVVDMPIPIARDGVEATRIDILKAVLVARALHAHVAHIVGAIEAADVEPETAQDRLIAGLLVANDAARRNGMVTAFEDFGFAADWLCRHADVMKILDANPEIFYVLDTGNKHAVGEKAVYSYPRVKNRIVHVHVKDWAEQPVPPNFPGCLLGEGVVAQDNIRIAKMLRADGYRGWVAYEPPLEADEREPLRSLVHAMPLLEEWYLK